MKKKKPAHLNDKTMKYKSAAQTKRQHQYLGLPGEFKTRYPQELVFPNMESGRMDELYSTDQNMLVDLEEETKEITEKTLRKFGKYVIFISYMYSIYVYLAVICHKKPKKAEECFQLSPSVYIKVHYYYISQRELWERYDNLIKKVKHNIELTDMEALDIAFISKFISKEHAQKVTKTLVDVFRNAIISDERLKIDVAAILGAMISKHFPDEETQHRLLERINMEEYENEMVKIVYEEFEDVLVKKDEEIAIKNQELKSKDDEIKSKEDEIKSKDNEIKSKNKQIIILSQKKEKYKEKIRQLNDFDDLNSPEAKKILSSLMLL